MYLLVLLLGVALGIVTELAALLTRRRERDIVHRDPPPSPRGPYR